VSERCGPFHANVVENDGQHVSSNDFPRPYLINSWDLHVSHTLGFVGAWTGTPKDRDEVKRQEV
jgi:hypothetical protein